MRSRYLQIMIRDLLLINKSREDQIRILEALIKTAAGTLADIAITGEKNA